MPVISHGWIAFLMIFSIQNISFAQSQWGTGLYGGMQSCPIDVRAGSGGISQSDEMEEIKDESESVAEQLKAFKAELNGKEGLNGEIRTRERKLRVFLIDAAVTDIRGHLVSGRTCNAWTGNDDQPVDGTRKTEPTKDETARSAIRLAAKSPDSQVVPEKLSAFRASAWPQVCDPNGRVINSRGACTSLSAIVTAPATKLHPDDEEACVNDMEFYKKAVLRRATVVAEIARLEAERDRLKKAYRAASKQFKKDLKDGIYDGETEGDYCVGCDFQRRQAYKREPDWANVGANLGMGLLGIYLGQRQTKMIAEYNSAQGFPTQNYASIGYGFPYIVNGLYGALGGGTGQGAFGCGGSIGGGGNANGPYGMAGPYGNGSIYGQGNGGPGSALWGYPQNMYGNANGGGQFNAGFSPWGMNGMNNPFGNGANQGIGGGFGGGFPGMGNGMGGFPGMGNGMGGFPGMGGGFGGQLGGGFGGGFPGMGNGMGGFPGMGNGMGGVDYLGQLQMQQQMMQMQMQQQQMQMQQYNQYVQNETRKAQVLSSLNMELQSLMLRIQTVQSSGVGALGTGYGGTVNTGFGGTVGVGGGFNVGIGAGVNYNGNSSYLFNNSGVGGNTGCVGLSCTPTTGVGTGTGTGITSPGR